MNVGNAMVTCQWDWQPKERLVFSFVFSHFLYQTQCYKTHISKLKMASENAFGSLRGKETIFIISRVLGFKQCTVRASTFWSLLKQGFLLSLDKQPCRFTCLPYACFIVSMCPTLRKGFDPSRSQWHNPGHSKP